MKEKGHDFIMKVSSTVKLCAAPGSHMSDGSYLAIIKGKIEDPAGSTNGRKKWKKVEIVVRVIVFQIPGFRPVRLITRATNLKRDTLRHFGSMVISQSSKI